MARNSSIPLVSVVTPFYNTAQYLGESIESVLGQSYRHFEHILVNNRSTDDSLAIAEEFAKRDDRIRVITNDVFLGKVQNYNQAMRHISSEAKYCKVVQADDWLFPECLEEMVRLAEDNPRVGLVSSYFFLGESLRNVGLPYPTSVFCGREIGRRQLMGGGFFFGNFTTTMIRAQIVRGRDPYYNEDTYHEDTESCYETLRDWDFGFVHRILSFTRTDNESLFKSTFHFNPDVIDFLISVHKYGPIYLDEPARKRRLEQVTRSYFDYLGRCAWSNRDPEFWKYHREGLRIIGYELRRRDLAKYSALALAKRVINPRLSLRALRRTTLRK